MNVVSKIVVAAALGTGLLAASAINASADIACTGGVCWHVHERYHYPARAHVVVHPDSWHVTKRYVIREHDGPGYWRGHRWVVIH